MGLLRRSRLQQTARAAASRLRMPWAGRLKAAPQRGCPRCNLLRPPAPDCRTACVAAPARPGRQAQARARPAAQRRALSGPRRRRVRQRRLRCQPPHLPGRLQRGPRTMGLLRHTCGAAGGRRAAGRSRLAGGLVTPVLSGRGHGLAAHACMSRAQPGAAALGAPGAPQSGSGTIALSALIHHCLRFWCARQPARSEQRLCNHCSSFIG